MKEVTPKDRNTTTTFRPYINTLYKKTQVFQVALTTKDGKQAEGKELQEFLLKYHVFHFLYIKLSPTHY